MQIQSSHDIHTYLYALRQSLGSPTDFGIERFTGIVLGRFFCITHHCDRQWNRRITAEQNTAIGYIRKAGESSAISFITTKGELRPQFLIPLVVISSLIWTFMNFKVGLTFLAIGFLIAIVSAFLDSLTDDGKDGHTRLLSLLKNPQNPYKNL